MQQREFDQYEFEQLLKILCTSKEISQVFHTTEKTLGAWVKRTYGRTYQDVADEFRADGKQSLRKKLFDMAGYKPAVAIFLAKNYLGMSDNPMPEPDGEETQAFAKAISKAVRALSKVDVSELAQVPAGASEDLEDGKE